LFLNTCSEIVDVQKPLIHTPMKINAQTRFVVASFLTPYSFGVRTWGVEAQAEFVNMKTILEEIGAQEPIKLDICQVNVGRTCLVKLAISRGKGDYNHNFKRAYIRNDAHDSTDRLNQDQKEMYPVLVDCIDVGEFQFVPLQEIYFFDCKYMNYGFPELFV
jgi:hypothetical protein